MYNNYSYGVISNVVERVSGEGFSEFLRGRILEPLGMTRTAVSKSDTHEGDNIAYPHA
jgi:CubicO group peptidase (beta-lactamase class C family)